MPQLQRHGAHARRLHPPPHRQHNPLIHVAANDRILADTRARRGRRRRAGDERAVELAREGGGDRGGGRGGSDDDGSEDGVALVGTGGLKGRKWNGRYRAGMELR